MIEIYLSAPAFCAGEERPIAELLEDPDRNKARDLELMRLMHDGFNKYRYYEGDIVEMVSTAMQAAVQLSGIAPDAIDGVMFASDSFWENEIVRAGAYFHGASRYRLLSTIRENGLVNAQPYATWSSACGNVGNALSLAQGLIAAGQYRNVLIVSFDKIPKGTSRLMGNGASIFSDGAAAFIVSADPQPWQLMAISSGSSTRLADPHIMFNAANPVVSMMETVKAVNHVKTKFVKQTGHPLSDYRFVLMPNVRSDVAAVMGGLLGISSEHWRRDTLPDYAHMHANDHLLTMQALDSAGLLPANEEFLMFNAGTWAWHLAAVRKTS